MIETDGRRVKAFGPSGYRPYTEMERNLLRQALYEAADLPQRDARPGCLREAERPSRRKIASLSRMSILSVSTARPCCIGPSVN